MTIQSKKIGYTLKPYGIKGAIKVTIEDQYWEDIARTSVLLINIEGRYIPHFIKKVIFDAPIRIIFEDHEDRAAVQHLGGKEIYIREMDILKPEEREWEDEELAHSYFDLIGFQMKDKEYGLIGTIENVVEYPQQEIAIIYYQDKEVLIPLNHHLIEEIREKEKLVIVNLPDGLLTL